MFYSTNYDFISGKLMLFYVVFYIILAALFASALAITFRFVEEDFPNYYHNKSGMEGHILFSPGKVKTSSVHEDY